MNSPGQSNGSPINANQVGLKFGNLEIRRDAVVVHFFEERTVIPLKKIASYHLKWYLHDPIFAKKWWFLVLTVTLKNGDEESGHVTSVKFNYLSDDSALRKNVAAKIARAIDAALLRTRASAKKESSSTTRTAVQATG
ncbi:MAG: hypothetical protein WAN04_11925 [Candidatus Udaeobacter sp.]